MKIAEPDSRCVPNMLSLIRFYHDIFSESSIEGTGKGKSVFTCIFNSDQGRLTSIYFLSIKGDRQMVPTEGGTDKRKILHVWTRV